MTLTVIYMALPAYLLIGCILMLIANELLEGELSQNDFLRGMLLWPIWVGYVCEAACRDIFLALERRRRG